MIRLVSLGALLRLPRLVRQRGFGAVPEGHPDGVDPFKSKYGDLPLVQSATNTPRQWTDIGQLSAAQIGSKVWLRARVHSTRIKGKGGFLILRQSCHTAQCVLFTGPTASREMVKFVGSISPESVVDVLGLCKAPQVPIAKCSQSQVEIEVEEVHVVSRAETPLPMQIMDASAAITAEEEIEENSPAGETQPVDPKKRAKVTMKTRLDNRVMDLRTPASSAILRISSSVSGQFRNFLTNEGFVEIHTPKLLAGSSEGGADVFRLSYFDKEACLAQSPQLYKQMAVMGDLDRVFEVAPVFRAEDSNTHRHLCEFTGLDFEMTIKEHYSEVTSLVHRLFVHMFKVLGDQHAHHIAAVKEHFPYVQPFQYTNEEVKITHAEAVEMLNKAGVRQGAREDLTTENEKKLGVIVKERYNTDFYVVHRYPSEVRPFYTMPCADDDKYTCSYDVFMRGEEIISGGQRIHDAALLESRLKAKSIDPAPLRDYLNSFRYGAFPHAGCGIGLERVVMLYLGLKNIRRVSMFPRDPKRLTP